MSDKPPTYQDRFRSLLHPEDDQEQSPKYEVDADDLEASPRAPFSYLRGTRDHASAIEFRFRNGNSVFFPYSWLGPWRHNPGEGLLLKFSGDLVYLVLIRGSNLDLPVKDGGANLTSAIQRQRVLWIREMTEEDIKSVGETGPTVDSIQVVEFESHAALKEWLSKNAPAFLE
jgi:hypothetical protein